MQFQLPPTLDERIYSGVLGKIIGVYLGRPFEQWSHERIVRELGEVHYYVHEKLDKPLIVADDDITGTFTFVRSFADNGFDPNLTATQIGHSWLNYIIENRTILWWGGMGMSTEHTAYLRLKDGIDAPASGSITVNGTTVAEQIGAQIFIDAWGMLAAGDPTLAADFAKRAGSVSHDGESVFAAQVIAAIEAAAFVESDLDKLLDIGQSVIPSSSLIHKLITDLRDLRSKSDDWHVGLARIHERYSYEIYDSNCHVIPNHAVVMLGLLWGDGDFDRSMMITCTAGYDTDCNAANVGCILGIRNGLVGLEKGHDWRGPVADRLLLPTADGGTCVNDALNVATELANAARRLRGVESVLPKGGSRFHFSMPGSVQGFMTDPQTPAAQMLSNTGGSLRLDFQRLAPGLTARIGTPTFLEESQLRIGGVYAIVATPTLYSSQTIRARLRAIAHELQARLVVHVVDVNDKLVIVEGLTMTLSTDWSDVEWVCPDTQGQPIAKIGIEVLGPAEAGAIEIDSMRWDGTPTLHYTRPKTGQLWRRAWVEAGNGFIPWHQGQGYMLAQNKERGLVITGTRDWRDYQVSTTFRPNMVKEFGLAARVQGLRRFCAILIGVDQTARLVEVLHTERVLAKIPFSWQFDKTQIELTLTVDGSAVTATINGEHRLTGTLNGHLDCGGIAIVCEEGVVKFDRVDVKPV